MNQLSITAVIAVRNEEKNIQRCLDSIQFVQRICVIDSQSTDATAEIARSSGAEVHQFQYSGNFPKKRQWALNELGIQTDWVLLLDADEVVPPELQKEMEAALEASGDTAGYVITKGFHFLGNRIRHGGFSHRAVLLIRNGKARFEDLGNVPGDQLDMEVHERVVVDGPIQEMATPLIHEDFKGLQAYIDKHNKYSTWEAFIRYRFEKTGKYGLDTIQPRLFGNAQERRRFLKKVAVKVPCESMLWFLYHFIFRLGFIEGRRGYIAAQIRKQYIDNVHAKLYELRLNKTEV